MSQAERLSRRLWLDSEHVALVSLYHPFVRGLATGTLPRWVTPFDDYLDAI